jgi:hypothetical protein
MIVCFFKNYFFRTIIAWLSCKLLGRTLTATRCCVSWLCVFLNHGGTCGMVGGKKRQGYLETQFDTCRQLTLFGMGNRDRTLCHLLDTHTVDGG